MNTKTVTEKFRAVNEGTMTKREFVRQMKQSYPMYVSQYDGFDSTVQILKNKGMLFEAPKKKQSKVETSRPEQYLGYSLDTLDRGIRIELEAAGIDIQSDKIKPDVYLAAEKKAKGNLDKNANHYLELLSGESNKVDKHDKEKEVKRGALDKDTFNDMKKATLKENIYEDEEEDARNDADYETGWADDPTRDESAVTVNSTMKEGVVNIYNKYGRVPGFGDLLKSFFAMHGDDLDAGADIEDEFEQFIINNSDSIKEESDYDTDGYVESMGPMFDKGVNFLVRAWQEWKMGPMTEPGMIGPAKKNVINYLDTQLTVENLEEKQGKDHDGDGDIDSDDYMAAKDKAIKKAMGKEEQLKEAVKSIIMKTLTEGNLNEAATIKLSDWAEGYESFTGVKTVVNELENIVTEIESFYDKMSDKIAKTFEKTSAFENEEGLKIGGFIAPSLESAFRQDLSKVVKKGTFFNKIELPKVRTITQADIDANNSGEKPLGETEIQEEPKSTIFTPNF